MRPKRASVCATTASRVSDEVMSPSTTSRVAEPASAKPAFGRPVTAILAPRAANCRAQLAPIPSEAPVIRTTFSAHFLAENEFPCICPFRDTTSQSPRHGLPAPADSAGQQIVFNDAPQRPEPIPPSDFLPLSIGAPVIADSHFVNARVRSGHLRRHLRLKPESVLFNL